jgi:hypothetical protein
VATSLDEFLVCLPGWGSTAKLETVTDSSNTPVCVPCQFGTYSPGGMDACMSCPDG